MQSRPGGIGAERSEFVEYCLYKTVAVVCLLDRYLLLLFQTSLDNSHPIVTFAGQFLLFVGNTVYHCLVVLRSP